MLPETRSDLGKELTEEPNTPMRPSLKKNHQSNEWEDCYSIHLVETYKSE